MQTFDRQWRYRPNSQLRSMGWRLQIRRPSAFRMVVFETLGVRDLVQRDVANREEKIP